MRLALVFFFMLLAPAVFAVQPDEVLADPDQEARARAVSAELRCLVCQNQSIDDSEADLAHDLRVLVRERIKAGDSDEAVRKFIVARYGDYVLLKPPFNADTLLLWAGPAILLLLEAGALFCVYRRHRSGEAQLSLNERSRLEELMRKPPHE